MSGQFNQTVAQSGKRFNQHRLKPKPFPWYDVKMNVVVTVKPPIQRFV